MNKINKSLIMKSAWQKAKQIYKDIQDYNSKFSFKKLFRGLLHKEIDFEELLGVKPRFFLSYTLTLAWQEYKGKIICNYKTQGELYE